MSFGFDKLADRKISEAIEDGLFDDLEGNGLPLNLGDDDPLTPPHLRMSNRILKNANVLPDWVQIDGEIRSVRSERDKLWSIMLSEYWRRKRSSQSELSQKRFSDWYQRMHIEHRWLLKLHNDEILKYNLAAPNSPTIFVPFRVEEEEARFRRAFPPPESFEIPPKSPESTSKGALRDATNAIYHAGLRRKLE